jgi:putative heme iron utilization protein
MSAAGKAALATIDRANGHPYVSLVTVALDEKGAPVLLLSRLARHTQNLDADPRGSLLFEPVDMAAGDPLALGRVTVMGTLAPIAADDPRLAVARARFLARHPDASAYAGFADFRFFAMAVERAHFIGGFGRIVEIDGADLKRGFCLAS